MSQLEKFKKVVKKYMVIRNTEYIDIIFGVVMANRLDSNPVWLYLVGVPSSGKTVMLEPLSGHPEVYALSRMTKNSLISGYARPKGRPRKDGKVKEVKDPSLLPKLNEKVLIIKDFTAMLCMRSQELHEVLGQLRDAYDGTARSRFGSGLDKLYKAKFGLIAAVTGSIDKQKPMLTELGERFLTFRLPKISRLEEYQRCMKASEVESMTEMKEELAEAAHEVLDMDPPVASIRNTYKKRILEVAHFVAVARCEVERNRFTKEPEFPQPEVALRLNKQLCDLAVGIAMVREKKAVTIDEVVLVQKVALHSLTHKRLVLLSALLHKYPDYISAKNIAEVVRLPVSTVWRYLEDLALLYLIDKKTVYEKLGKQLQPVYHYRLKKDKLVAEILGDERYF